MTWRGGGTQRDRKESKGKRQGRKQDRSDRKVLDLDKKDVETGSSTE